MSARRYRRLEALGTGLDQVEIAIEGVGLAGAYVIQAIDLVEVLQPVGKKDELWAEGLEARIAVDNVARALPEGWCVDLDLPVRDERS